MRRYLKLLLFLIFILMLIKGNTSFNAAFIALNLWYEKLIPSLFPIMVVVKVLYQYHILEYLCYPFNNLLKSIFHINANAFIYVLSSIILGFPTSSLLIGTNDYLTKNQKKRLIYTCSFASPPFIIITCGSQMYHSSVVGYKLFCISLCSGLLLLFFTRNTSINITKKIETTQPFAILLSDAILSSIKTLFMIGGYLMLVMSIQAVLTPYLPPILTFPLNMTIEFASGSAFLSNQVITSNYKYILQSGLLGFGGFCVHLQVLSMNQNCHLSYRSYFKYRMAQAFISLVIAYFIFR